MSVEFDPLLGQLRTKDSGGSGAGTEIGNDFITGSSPIVITSTTVAAGTTIVSCAAHTFDGAPVMAHFYVGLYVAFSLASNEEIDFNLFEGSTQIGTVFNAHSTGGAFTGPQGSIAGFMRFTPSAGSHTYTVTAVKSVGTGTAEIFFSGLDSWIRFTKI